MTKKDHNGWVVTIGAFIGLVGEYWYVPYVAMWWIMMASYSLGVITGIKVERDEGNL